MRSMPVFMSMPPSLRFGRSAGIQVPLAYAETLSAFMPNATLAAIPLLE
jgi:hypothetical protein